MHPTPKRAPADRRDEVWKALFERQLPAVQGGMCEEYRRGLVAAGLSPLHMPRPDELSTRLLNVCGWRIETVQGLIPVRDFFTLLRDRRFPSPDWIRHPDDLEYTPEPDAFHDLFGHVPQLTSPRYTAVLENLAFAARSASDAELAEIERVYWFTMEFGLVREKDEFRALGAGLASSIAELDRALHSRIVQRRRFRLFDARRTPFETDKPQDLYLISDSLEALAKELRDEVWARRRRAS